MINGLHFHKTTDDSRADAPEESHIKFGWAKRHRTTPSIVHRNSSSARSVKTTRTEENKSEPTRAAP